MNNAIDQHPLTSPDPASEEVPGLHGDFARDTSPGSLSKLWLPQEPHMVDHYLYVPCPLFQPWGVVVHEQGTARDSPL